MTDYFTVDTPVREIRNHPAFESFGDLLFPIHQSIPNSVKLKDIGRYYIWYNYMNPNKTVEIVNYLKEQSEAGNIVFYSIYSKDEKRKDPQKRNAGLFFFRGKEYAKTAIVNAGGGFMYVGAMHDSFPHALEISKMGYNAFALIYRPGSDTACEDLARAIAFLFDHKKELKIDMNGYSLWGGSAGARMAAWLGSLGTAYFGEADYPQAGAVIMQYTGLSQVFGNEPPTYNCVGTNDGIASSYTMEHRIQKIRNNGTSAQIEIFKGLPHGFGLGEGTIAEGWIFRAIDFWIRNI
jgi:acetyl esterase/lipase